MSEVNPNYNPQADFDNFGEEMDGLVDKMASASDKLESLKDNFDGNGVAL